MMKWMWLAYPLAVLAVIVMATNYLLGEGANSFQNVKAKQERAKLTEQRLIKMNKKLTLLSQTDPDKTRKDLEMVAGAMPPKKEVWMWINQLNAAASGSGAKLISYNGAIGDIKEASESGATIKTELYTGIEAKYDVKEFKDVVTILDNLRRSLPLIKILNVDYKEPKLSVTVEGAWSPWSKISSMAEEPLPQDYMNMAEKIREETKGYKNFALDVPGKVEISASQNPF